MKIPFVSFEYTNKTIRADVLNSFERFFDKAWYVLGEDLKNSNRSIHPLVMLHILLA